MNKIREQRKIPTKIVLRGVSVEGLQRLHKLQLSDENDVPSEVANTRHSFNGSLSFFSILSAKLKDGGYKVRIRIYIFEERKSWNGDRSYFALISQSFLVKIFRAIDPELLPKTFKHI